MPRLLGLLVVPLLALLVVGSAAATAQAAPRPLPAGTDVDYQLGGNRPVPRHVGIVVRDHNAAPTGDRYDICYVNGFQTQSDERAFWRRHWSLVLKRDGKPVVDEAWGEWLLDLRTKPKREHLARIVGRWIHGCADDGFDAVELDNLDSFTRSHHLLSRRDTVAFARLLVGRAHDAGLAAGQKNLAGFNGTRIGYDFAVAEECGRYHECASYLHHYGRRVLAVEYRRKDFRWTCRHVGARLPVVLRDLDLSPTGVRRWC